MQYTLPTPHDAPIEFNLDIGLRYGEMPDAMLMSKFEETDTGPDEHLYDDYARRQLIDRRPDAPFTAADEPRSGVNRNYGRLQLQYYGHRGDADPPAHPEMFIDFAGSDNVDPRGHAIDPDMNRLREQRDKRMRFINWNPDHQDSITGGGRSEAKVMADKQSAFRWIRDRLKVFSSQKDGRREGMRKTWRHISALNNQLGTAPRGESVGFGAEGAQIRRATIIARAIRDSKAYRDDCADQSFEAHKYGQTGRRRQRNVTANALLQVNPDGKMGESDASKCYKAVGVLLGQLVRARHEVAHDADYGAEGDVRVRKHERVAEDLSIVLRSIANEHFWTASHRTVQAKTAMPGDPAQTINMVSLNHSLPASHYLIAEKMYKGLTPGADRAKINEDIVREAVNPTLKEDFATRGKLPAAPIEGGAARDNLVAVVDQTRQTHNYKTAVAQSEAQLRLANGEGFTSEGKPTPIKKTSHGNYRVTTAQDIIVPTEFGDSRKKERLLAPMGNKDRVRRNIDTDGGSGALRDLS